jgi:hypothetical protein
MEKYGRKIIEYLQKTGLRQLNLKPILFFAVIIKINERFIDRPHLL